MKSRREYHPKHLNTPRLVANQSGQTVWRWDQQEPFGVNVPDENPSSLGAFEFPLRFPGQYADKETGLAYNMARDYASDTGRYVQSDPIGLAGGINTYAYVGSSPLSFIDPLGLQAIPFPVTPPIAGPNSGASSNIARALNNLINKIVEACKPEEPCNPPEGTKCYEGPDCGKPHAGASPHYHIYEMQRRGKECFWRYLGGKLGRGVLTEIPAGMQECSSYPNFTGRGGR